MTSKLGEYDATFCLEEQMQEIDNMIETITENVERVLEEKATILISE